MADLREGADAWCGGVVVAGGAMGQVQRQPVIATEDAMVTVDGLRFRNANRDGTLEPYEDWRLPADARAMDLVKRMSVEEKAGLIMHGSLWAKVDPGAGEGGKVLVGSAFDLEDAREADRKENMRRR